MKCDSQYVRCFVVALALGASACVPHDPPTPKPAAPTRVIGYYAGASVRRGFRAKSIKGNLLTHINYAFGRILPDGSAALGNPAIDTATFRDLLRLKRHYPHLKVLISFGGWSGSKYFSEAAATASSRARFVESTMELFFRAHPGVFDGVDLDWEYPTGGGLADNVARPEDRENLTLLVRDLRRALDAEAGSDVHFLITAALPAGRSHIAKYELRELADLMDFINLMTYDYHTAGRIAHFNAPLAAAADDPTPQFNIVESVSAYQEAGVPADKLVVGVPFYGYGYAGVGPLQDGRFQPAERNGFESTTGARIEWTGVIRFYQIRDAMRAGFVRHFDDTARVPWLYNAVSRVWITYDDAQSMGEKAAYVRAHRLGGIMIWELSGDRGKLLPVIVRGLSGLRE